jgi:AhpD family alkylhydroperoxidase
MADEICSNCRLPLDSNREQVRRISQVTYCQLCFELHQAVADRPGLVEAQKEWRDEQALRKRLMPGSDYFSK